MIFESELTRLNAISLRLNGQNEELKALAAARAARASELRLGAVEEDIAFRSGQDGVWSEWLAKRGEEVSRNAARLGAEREKIRLAAQKALGRQEALRQIRARQRAEERLKSSRKREH